MCPEGYFGENCHQACRCHNENYLCHASLGCVCQPSYHGSNCSVPIWLPDPGLPSHSSGHDNDGGAGSVVGVIVTILIMSLVIFITITYRKRIQSLKSQLSHVHYSNHHRASSCQAGSSHHFDNPVYATCSVNNTRLHNSIVKNVNIGREKSNTLPASRRVFGHVPADTCAAGAEDDELSDNSSEKGESGAKPTL